jgi:hypothetical protein
MIMKEKYLSSILAGVCLSLIALFIGYLLQLGDSVHRVLGFAGLIPVAVYGVIVSRRKSRNRSSRISAALILAFVCSLAGVYVLAWLRPRLYNAAATHYPRATAYAYVLRIENILLAVTLCLYSILLVLVLYETVHCLLLEKRS